MASSTTSRLVAIRVFTVLVISITSWFRSNVDLIVGSRNKIIIGGRPICFISFSVIG
jgi:hypothetical protein